MSFTSNIKNEIATIQYSESENIAELSAILNIGAKIEDDKFEIFTENVSVARRIYTLIKDTYHVDIEMDTSGVNSLRKNRLVLLMVKEKLDLILSDLCIVLDGKRVYVPHNYLIDEIKDKQAYLRGVFIMCGSINDPKTSRYHAEFVIYNEETANFVNSLLNELNFKSKVIKRNGSYMVYIKESEKISDFIKMLNATNSLFYYEDIRIYRDHKNMVNRLNNCEQANVEKSMRSANEQLSNIKYLKDNDLLSLLDEKTKLVIEYREKYPETTLQELADIISLETDVVITKSGINHHFRKIKELVERHKNK